MTIAQARAVKTKRWGAIATLLLSGCNATPNLIYRIDGAVTDFCVPRSIDVTPHRSNEGKVIRGGFTLNGCWRSESKNCIGPDYLIASSISDKINFIGRRYADLPRDAYLSSNARENRKYAEVLGEKKIVIPDGANAQRWYLWSVGDVHELKMSADDQIEAICTASVEAGGYLCDRNLPMYDYLLGYSFFADSKAPLTLTSIDKKIVAEIEKMRCQKSRG